MANNRIKVRFKTTKCRKSRKTWPNAWTNYRCTYSSRTIWVPSLTRTYSTSYFWSNSSKTSKVRTPTCSRYWAWEAKALSSFSNLQDSSKMQISCNRCNLYRRYWEVSLHNKGTSQCRECSLETTTAMAWVRPHLRHNLSHRCRETWPMIVRWRLIRRWRRSCKRNLMPMDWSISLKI